MNYAFVTVLSTNNYYKGVVALFESIKSTGTKYNTFVVIVNETIHPSIIDDFIKRGYIVEKRKKLSFDFVCNKVYDYWKNTFDKFYVFDLIEYDKIIYLDSDMYILKNIDELFDYPHMSAVIAGHDKYKDWKKINSGLMVIEPQRETSTKLVEMLKSTTYDKDVSDQDIIEAYFNWKDKNLAISEKYNLLVSFLDFYVNELGYGIADIFVLHFIGNIKPWMLSKIDQEQWRKKYSNGNRVFQLKYFNEYLDILNGIENVGIKLSIITPFYNTLQYTKRLADGLVPQLNQNVEWIIVDDGTNAYELDQLNAKVIHLKNNSGNASHPRNVGLDNAEGEFVVFIDSDDQVTSDYVEKILNKINTDDFDYCYFSWKTKDQDYIIKDEPLDWNHSIWNCIYRRDLIGDERFDENRNLDEDGDFNRRVRKGKKANILDILYIYSWREREDSLSSLYASGKIQFIKDDFTFVVLGTKRKLNDQKMPFKTIYYDGNLKRTLEKIHTRYTLFLKEGDLLTDDYLSIIKEKTRKEFDCCFINFKCNYRDDSNQKISTDYQELSKVLPVYGSYIWSFIYKTSKLSMLLDCSRIDEFNSKVHDLFKATDCINNVVYIHNPETCSIIQEEKVFLPDHKNSIFIKNAIYIASTCNGTFNGYISWLRNIGKAFGKKYEITILYDELRQNLYEELCTYFKCIKVDSKINYICSRLLVTYSTYFYPKNIICLDKNYMFIHGNTSDYPNSRHFMNDIYTEYIGVSKIAAKKAKGYYPTDKINYILNPFVLDKKLVKPHLKLVTAMRSSDIKRPERIAIFAKALDELEIPYTWNVFTDKNENTNINGLIYRKRVNNPMPYISDSDYLVLLSDSESFSYCVLEALSVHTKVIVTPLEVYHELGVINGKNGYIIPFNYFEECNKEKLKKIIRKIYKNKNKTFEYKYDRKSYSRYNDIFIV